MISSGAIVILNGAPRSGKSSIAAAMQGMFDGIWLNLGVDAWMLATPDHLRPGIGLRPGGERPDLEPAVLQLYTALYASAAACSRAGFNVVMDVGHHESYASSPGVLQACAPCLDNLTAVFVGVRCPVDVVLRRRRESGWTDESKIEEWEREVHRRWVYDVEVDTSHLSPETCARQIANYLDSGVKPVALWRNAGLDV